MAEKILNTRIQLKYASLSDWNNSTLVLKPGEIAIATVPTGDTSGASRSLPAVLAKVGDGEHTFSQLPWMQAVSSDIYSWAKSENKPSYTADEIEGLAAYIGGKVQDTNTTYQLIKVSDYSYKLQSKELGATTWSDVSTLTIPNKTADIEALQALVGSTAVSTQISNAIAALDVEEVAAGTGEVIGAISEVDGKVVATTKALTKADIPTIDQSQVDGLAAALQANADAITSAINGLDVADAAVANQFVSAVSEENGKITVSRRALTADDIPALTQSKITGLTDALAAKQDTIAWESDNYDAATNKAITKADLEAAVSGLSGATHFVGIKESLPASGASGDICIIGTKEYIYDGSAWQLLGDETAYIAKGTTFKNADIASDAAIAQSKIAGLTDALAAKADASALDDYQTTAAAATDKAALETEIGKKQNTLTFDGTYNASSNKVATVSTVSGAIAALDVEDTAVATQLVSAVSEADGKITVSRRALVAADIPTLEISKVSGLQTALDAKANDTDLAAIAKTGNVNDLVQTKGDVLVFDCGGAE